MSQDLLTQLAEYGAYCEERQGTVDATDVIGSVVPVPTPVLSSRPVRGWLVAAAAAVFVLVLIGSVGLLARVMGDSQDVPVTDDPVVTTTTATDAVDEAPNVVEEAPIAGGSETSMTPWPIEDIPSDAQWGTLDTPIGPAHWVHLTNAVPGNVGGMEALAWPAGFAMFQSPTYTYPDNREELHPAKLWVSPDGIEWHIEPLPIDPAAVEASLTFDGGAYWLTSTDPNGLWRSTDGATWQEYDPSSLAPPGPSWDSGLSAAWLEGARLASIGELTVLYATYSDDHGGSNTIPDNHVERLYLIDDNTIERVDVPWRPGSVTLFAVTDFVYAYVVNEQSDRSGTIVGGDISVWRTTDGRSWTDLGPLSLPDRPPSHAVRFASAGDTLTITFFDTSFSGSEYDTAWETTDGVNWTPLPSGRPEDTHPVHVETGWFSTVGDQGGPLGGQAWWMNVGDTWVPLEDISASRFCDGSAITAVANTTFIFGRGCVADIWILHLDR
jgi:hypothetical protein